jgi:predicted GNAT superfamily acetyltransferase
VSIILRAVKDVDGCNNFNQLQARIWGSGEEDLVPNHVLITCIKNGGALLGAFADDGPRETGGMIGAAFWWLGSGPDPEGDGIRLKACSHIVGVLPEWQGLGVGLRLKLAQREAVLEQGIADWITWTYDPLYLANGIFNIHRLGGVCNTYGRNIYGEMTDALNRGVPSDRCQVDWLLNSSTVLTNGDSRRLSPAIDPAILNVLPSRRRENGFLEPLETTPITADLPIALPIPENIAAIRATDGGLSMAWRMYMRQVLESAFVDGYAMTDCIKLPDRDWHYILTKKRV